MAKTVEDPQIAAIRKAVEDKKAVLGAKRALKGMRSQQFSQIYVTTNAADDVKSDIAHYSSITGVPVVELTMTNKELGVVCKKPFIVSVLAVQN